MVLRADTARLAVGIHRRLLLRPPGPVHGLLYVYAPHHGLSNEGRPTPGESSRAHGYRKVVYGQVNNAPSKTRPTLQYMSHNWKHM